MNRISCLAIAVICLLVSSCTKTIIEKPVDNTNNGNNNTTGPWIASSNPFEVSNWSYDSFSRSYWADFEFDAVIQAVQDSGVVEIYKEYSNGWTNLPDINGNAMTVFNFRTGGYTISIFNIDMSKPDPPGTIKFRTVVIAK